MEYSVFCINPKIKKIGPVFNYLHDNMDYDSRTDLFCVYSVQETHIQDIKNFLSENNVEYDSAIIKEQEYQSLTKLKSEKSAFFRKSEISQAIEYVEENGSELDIESLKEMTTRMTDARFSKLVKLMKSIRNKKEYESQNSELLKKLENYKGNNNFILSIKNQAKAGSLSEKQISAVENAIKKEESVPQISEEIIDFLKNYSGRNSFLISMQNRYYSGQFFSENMIKALNNQISPKSEKIENHSLENKELRIKAFSKRIHNLASCTIKVLEVLGETNGSYNLKVICTERISERCMCCGEKLTNSLSIVTGIGPICLKKIGGTTKMSEIDAKALVKKWSETNFTEKTIRLAKSQIEGYYENNQLKPL